MSAQLQADQPQLWPMTVADLDAVMAVEARAYEFPWTRGNMIDSLAAGYLAMTLHEAGGPLLGYYVAMGGVDEMHLLNLTVTPTEQGRGHARRMLDDLVAACRARAASSLWLEVRFSNQRAARLYQHYGFSVIGVRRAYYPAAEGKREDAQVMRLNVLAGGGSRDAH